MIRRLLTDPVTWLYAMAVIIVVMRSI